MHSPEFDPPVPHKLSMTEHTDKPSIWEVEVGESEAQRCPQLHRVTLSQRKTDRTSKHRTSVGRLGNIVLIQVSALFKEGAEFGRGLGKWEIGSPLCGCPSSSESDFSALHGWGGPGKPCGFSGTKVSDEDHGCV